MPAAVARPQPSYCDTGTPSCANALPRGQAGDPCPTEGTPDVAVGSKCAPGAQLTARLKTGTNSSSGAGGPRAAPEETTDPPGEGAGGKASLESPVSSRRHPPGALPPVHIPYSPLDGLDRTWLYSSWALQPLFLRGFGREGVLFPRRCRPGRAWLWLGPSGAGAARHGTAPEGALTPPGEAPPGRDRLPGAPAPRP